jgi:hypothetical protein
MKKPELAPNIRAFTSQFNVVASCVSSSILAVVPLTDRTRARDTLSHSLSVHITFFTLHSFHIACFTLHSFFLRSLYILFFMYFVLKHFHIHNLYHITFFIFSHFFFYVFCFETLFTLRSLSLHITYVFYFLMLFVVFSGASFLDQDFGASSFASQLRVDSCCCCGYDHHAHQQAQTHLGCASARMHHLFRRYNSNQYLKLYI